MAEALENLNILRNNQRNIILNEQQEVAVEELLLGKDVLAVLPTSQFWKEHDIHILRPRKTSDAQTIGKDAATCMCSNHLSSCQHNFGPDSREAVIGFQCP